jgi:hypothetical protein
VPEYLVPGQGFLDLDDILADIDISTQTPP